MAVIIPQRDSDILWKSVWNRISFKDAA